MFLRYQQLQHVFECCLWALTHRPTVVLALLYYPVDDTLFEVSPEISCSNVSNRYCCYGNHTSASKPILKLFIVVNRELNKASLCQKQFVKFENW